MSFRLVPKSVTLNDLERRSGHYFALFHRIRVRCCRKTIIRPIPRFQTLLLIVYDHINTICAIIRRVFGQNKRRQQPRLQTVVATPMSPDEFLVAMGASVVLRSGLDERVHALKLGLMGRQVAQMLSRNQEVGSMGVGAGLYMYDVVVEVHVRYLIS